MKTKLLAFLVLLFFGGLFSALAGPTDTIRSLIISEVRFDAAHESYVELTNKGDSTLHLRNFEFGIVHPWTARNDVSDIGKWFNVAAGSYTMLPDWTLDPGKSIVIAHFFDYTPKAHAVDPDHWDMAITKAEMWKVADIQVHAAEAHVQPTVGDSVSKDDDIFQTWQGRECWYLRQHIDATDSVVVDQCGGVFTGTDGSGNPNGFQSWGPEDVAGFSGATENAILIRKHNITVGNIDFNTGRGTTAAESEWIAVPILVPGGYEPNRALFWTVHNDVDAHLSDLVSNTMTINLTDSTILVPWGVRHDDSIMYQFDRAPGFAWKYDYSPNYNDSSLVSVRTGDIFTIYACGNEKEEIPFKLSVAAPNTDADIVVPKKVPDAHLTYVNAGPFCWVTDKVPGMDTIRSNDYVLLNGIPYATPVDTLLKYLEKAPNASWKIIYHDGMTRPYLQNGDILEVTAEDETSVKDYFIKVDHFKGGHNAALASITWPDIPDSYRDTYGWQGDTISGFLPSKYNYQVTVPFDVVGIPALVGKNADINASLAVSRAKNLTGSKQERTVTFTSTAADGLTVNTYSVELLKGKDLVNIQPWRGEPFISQYCLRQDSSNDFMEIVNPGTETLDLSHYMLTFSGVSTPADAITFDTDPTIEAWNNRYVKYIPGMRWEDSTSWKANPAIAVLDDKVFPVVLPGDVFVLADMRTYNGPNDNPGGTAARYLVPQIDIDFAHNPWGETLNQGQAMDQWWPLDNKLILFKILNDSVYNGMKPAKDPNDFKVIDMFGWMGSDNSTNWVIGGYSASQATNWTRKPFIYKGNPLISSGVYPGGSFGTDENNSEWTMVNEARLRLTPYNYAWPTWRILVADGIGSHFMNTVTVYKSTISSQLYKYTEGYSLNESLWGLVTGTTVNEFLGNILKADTAQRLHVYGAVGLLIDSDIVMNMDTLLVLSADSVNTSKYILTVTPGGLSKNDTLASDTYTIDITGNTGTVSGFDYGTLLKDLVAGITIPERASMNIINASGAYQPLKVLNYDTMYVDAQVSDQIYLEVIAENGVDKIVYQLKPNTSPSDAFVISDVFSVDQELGLISLVPTNTTVYGLFRYLTPAPGATMMMLDKAGFERTDGFISLDDQLVVTSSDLSTTRTYRFSVLCFGCYPPYYPLFVLSDIYSVDQVNYSIEIAYLGSIKPLVSDFLANLTPAPGASLKVVSAAGIENTGILACGDKVEVTAVDGMEKIYYTIQGMHWCPAFLAYVLSDVYLVDQINLTIFYDFTQNILVSDFLSALRPSPSSTLKIVNAQHVENNGILAPGDRVEVSTAGQADKIYYYLSAPYHCSLPFSNLAFVLSDFYTIDQVNYEIDGSGVHLYPGILVSDFVTHLIPASGASIKLVNAQGVENTGILAIGDNLIVIAADNFTQVTYSIIFDPLTVNQIENSSISVYPNPTSGNFSLSGISAGSRIIIRNILGRNLFETYAASDIVQLSLEGQPSGIYLIQISNDTSLTCFKLIVK